MTDVSLLDAALLLLTGVAAGWIGVLVGVGGGVVVVPVLFVGLGVDFRVAVATALVGVLATSVTAGTVHTASGVGNLRLGVVLELATTIGAVIGGLVTTLLATSVLSGIFAVVAAATAVYIVIGIRHPVARTAEASEVEVAEHTLGGAYFDGRRGGLVRYRVERLPVGLGISAVAGALSGLLGVGGGFIKVPALNLIMKVPIRVAAATSNFMVGLTAAASIFVYFAAGYVVPLIAAPVAIGVVAGSIAGALRARLSHPDRIRALLAAILVLVAIEMALRAGGIGVG